MYKLKMMRVALTENFYDVVKNGFTIPRWTIFIIDLVVCAFSLFFAYLLRFNLDFEAVWKYGILFQVLVITELNIIFFRVFRTYEGIIRLSSAKEGFRCVSAVFCSSFLLLLSVAGSAILKLPYILPISVLIIYFFTASFLIFAYRIWIKILYNKCIKGKLAAENVLIFGKAVHDALLKNAVESIPDRQYRVIGFIGTNENLVGKSIDSIKFYSVDGLKSIAEKHNVKYFFLGTQDIDLVTKNKIVDYCLSKNISIKVIPAIQMWVDGQLQMRQLKNLNIEDLLNRPSIKLMSMNLRECVAGKRILITGAAGSIGTEIVKQLVQIKAKQLILCDNRETAMHELQYQLEEIAGKEDNIIYSISDVRSKDVMDDLFYNYRPQIVFHAAAYKHVPLMEMHPCEAIKCNVLGTKIVSDLSLAYGVERFVLISTDKAINPTNVMGASKRIAEMYISELQTHQHFQRSFKNNFDPLKNSDPSPEYFTKFITTRFGNVLDSNGSVIPRFKTQIEKGGPVTVTHPEIVRFFMTIPEACSLVLEAANMGNGGEIFVFDMGDQVKIADLADRMIKLAGLVPGKDINIEYIGLRPGEKLYEEILNKSEEVVPTHHKKIMISKVAQNKLLMASNIDHLIQLAEKNKNTSVVKQMKMIVKEFKSNNSPYEELDLVKDSDLIAV